MSRMLIQWLWRIVAVLAIVCAGFGSAPAATAQDAAEAPPQDVAALQARIEALMREHKVPGASIALVSRDAVLWAGGLGVADVASGRPATAETRFRIGSISKTFISLAVLQQQEAGRLSLSDTLSSRAPEIQVDNRWEATAPVRLEHLLEHTAGFDDLSLHDYGTEAPDVSLPDSLAQTGESRRVRWQPGRSYFYSNVGPVAAARVVENVSGQAYAEYVDEHIFRPLGISSASYFLPADVRATMATSYEADGVTVLPATNPLDWPSGTLTIAPGDMASFIQMMLNRGSYRGTTLLQPASIERMERPATSLGAQNGLRVGYGLGLEIMVMEQFVFYGHSGATDGFLSYVGYLPDAGLGYYLSINSANDEGFVAIIELINAYLTRDLPKPAPPATAQPDGSELDQLTGYYALATPSSVPYTTVLQSITGIMRVTRDGAGLAVGSALGSPKAVIPVGPRLFRAADEPVASIAFSDPIDGARFMQVKARSLRHIPTWMAWLRLGIAALFLLGILSSLLFALIWVPRWLFGRLRGVGHLNVRVWPTLAGLCFLGMMVMLMFIPDTTYVYIAKYSRPTVWSIGLCALTLLFAGFTIAGAVQALRSFRWEMRRGVRIYAAGLAAINLITLLYLASFGMIGVMSWR
jgi:CubicO group peptidase (beta-lactamase class C family)